MTEVKYNENRFVIISSRYLNAMNMILPKTDLVLRQHKQEILSLNWELFRTISDMDMMESNITLTGLESDENRWTRPAS